MAVVNFTGKSMPCCCYQNTIAGVWNGNVDDDSNTDYVNADNPILYYQYHYVYMICIYYVYYNVNINNTTSTTNWQCLYYQNNNIYDNKKMTTSY